MAKQNINVGTAANDKKGDSLRAAFQKVNANFTELYTALGLAADTTLNFGNFVFESNTVRLTNANNDDSTATQIEIAQPVRIESDLTVGGDIVPNTANGGNLGSPAKPFRSLYVSNSTIFFGGVPLSLEPGTNELQINNVPISQRITYADIPNAPTDVSDLTDTGNLLGGGDGGGLSITDFGEGFTDSLDDGKITTSKLYNENPNQGLNNLYVLEVTNGGVVVLPDQSIINGATLKTVAGNYAGITAGPASPAGKDEDSWVWVDNNGATIATKYSTDAHTWTFNNDGDLTLPAGGDILNSAGASVLGGGGAATGIESETDVSIKVNLSDSTQRIWQFGEDGNLTFPSGMTMGDLDGVEGIRGGVDSTIGILSQGTSGASVLQWVDDFEEATAVAAVVVNSLFAPNTGTVQIFTGDVGPAPEHSWTFGTDGALTLPTGGHIGPSGGKGAGTTYGGANDHLVSLTSYYNSGLYSSCVTAYADGTLNITAYNDGGPNPAKIWTFDNTGTLTLPDDSGIKSSTNIDITIDTPDSSTFNWRFGADGNTTFPTGLTLGAPRGVGTVNFTAAVDKEFQIETGTATSGKLWQFGTDGDLKIPGDIKSNGNINIDINLADSTLRRWQFGEDGSLTLPIGVSIDNNVDPLYPKIIADSGKLFSVQGQGSTGSAALAWSVDPNADTKYAAVGVSQGGGDNLAKVVMTAGNTTATLKVWKLDETGVFTLPTGGVISEGGGISGAIRLKPAGGANANQALLIYPTAAADGDHVHLTAGGGTTELYLGNDTHYVKLVNGGNVEVRASTANLSAQAAWTFETDGELDTIRPLGIKVPNGVPTDVAVINSTSGSWELNPRSDLATTGGSGSGLTVNVTETGGYASTIAIAEIAGTGYLNGDVITVTSGTSNATFTIVIGGRNTWQFGTDRALTLPSGTSNIQSVQQDGYQSKVTVSPYQILSQARRSQTQSYSATNEDFTSAASDGNGMIAFVGLQGGVAEFITDTIENGGVYERTVRLNGAGPEYGYSSFNDTDDQVFLVAAAPAGAVTSIRFSYTRISKIDIDPDGGVFRIESEPSQDIDIQSGQTLRLIADDAVEIRSTDATSITTNYGIDARTWEFGTGGNLTLPYGAVLRNLANNAIAFGQGAGANNSQGGEAVAIGTNAGYGSQGAGAVAIGESAGETDQGANAVAIGKKAGYYYQAANSIILNATGDPLEQTVANTFTVAPIRNISATSGVLQYNSSTKEVSYSNRVTAESFDTDQITIVGNRITTTVTNANLEIECNGTGSVVVNGGKLILNTGGNAYVESVDYGVNSANSALNIFGGPYQKINLRAGFGTQATLTLATDGTLTLPGSIVGTATQDVFNTTSTTVNAFGAATTALNIGASGAPITGFAATATTSSTASSLGYLGLPQSATATTATLAIGDAGKHIYVTTNSQTITIPANASVAYPIGTTLTFIAGPSATTVSIAITSDTLRLAGGTSTGTRTLAANGMATAVKVAATTWYINGTGLT
jgi:hypothetical protein